MSRTVTIECRFPVAPSEVYGAFAREDQLRQWFAEHARVSFEQGTFEFWGGYTPGAPDRAVSRLIDHEAGSRLRFEWTLRGEPTEVTVECAGEGKETRLTVSQTLPPRPFGEPSLADFWTLSLENLRRFLLGVSDVVFCDYSTPPHGGVKQEIDVNGEPGQVFRALIEPAELERYLATKATVEPKVGGRYDLGWGAGPIKILDLEPRRKLSYSWQYGDDPETIVTWTLDGSGGRTRLTLVHNGFAPDRHTEDYRTGWLKFMNELKSMVEIGPSWVSAKLHNPDHEEER